jgi:hypothetical protein
MGAKRAISKLLSSPWNFFCFTDVHAKIIIWICCVSLCWTLWNTRNELTTQGVFPLQLIDAWSIQTLHVFAGVWKTLAKKQDREELEKTIGKICSLHGVVRNRPHLSYSLVFLILLFASLNCSRPKAIVNFFILMTLLLSFLLEDYVVRLLGVALLS